MSGTKTLIHVHDRDQAMALANPNPPRRSRSPWTQVLSDFLHSVHGQSGTGDGLVGAKFIIRPFDLTRERTEDGSEGYIFGTVTFGGAFMPRTATTSRPAKCGRGQLCPHGLVTDGAKAQSVASNTQPERHDEHILCRLSVIPWIFWWCCISLSEGDARRAAALGQCQVAIRDSLSKRLSVCALSIGIRPLADIALQRR